MVVSWLSLSLKTSKQFDKKNNGGISNNYPWPVHLHQHPVNVQKKRRARRRHLPGLCTNLCVCTLPCEGITAVLNSVSNVLCIPQIKKDSRWRSFTSAVSAWTFSCTCLFIWEVTSTGPMLPCGLIRPNPLWESSSQLLYSRLVGIFYGYFAWKSFCGTIPEIAYFPQTNLRQR